MFDRPRGPRAPQLTPLGEIILRNAREVPAQCDLAENAVERFEAVDSRVDIGTFETVTNVLLPSVVRLLRQEHPDCDIRLAETRQGGGLVG